MTYILLVDDEPPLLDAVAEFLQDEGYSVRQAQHGQQAFAILGSIEMLPCVILLDVLMPLMDGFTFRQLQLQAPLLASIPVIFMSAASVHQQRAAQLGADFLPKPFTWDELRRAVRRYCPL